MRYLTWKLIAFAAATNAIGGTITDLALFEEKMERARNKAG